MHRDVPDGPLESGAPYWYWLGGRPALDFVNTRRERWRRNVECLLATATPSTGSCAARPARRQPMRAPARPCSREARALREAIDAGVRAAVAGAPRRRRGASRLIDDWLALRRLARPRWSLGADGRPRARRSARRADSPRRALGMVALDAARMLGTAAERARIRICGSETCSARFYDRSPAGRAPLVLDGRRAATSRRRDAPRTPRRWRGSRAA